MLQSWAVGFRRNCTLLLDTARGFPVRVGWIGFSGALYGLFAGAYTAGRGVEGFLVDHVQRTLNDKHEHTPSVYMDDPKLR